MDSIKPKTDKPSSGIVFCFIVIIMLSMGAALSIFYPHDRRGLSRKISCASNMRQIGLGMLMYAQDNDEQLPPRQAQSADGSSVSWRVAIYPYIKSLRVFQCLSNPNRDGRNIESRENNEPKDSDFARSYAVNSTSDGAQCFGPFSGFYPRGFPVKKAAHSEGLLILVESTAAYSDFNVLAPQIFRWPASEHSQTGSLFIGHYKTMNTDRYKTMNALFCDGHVKALSVGQLTGADPVAINSWTVDGVPFAGANQVKAASVVEYGARQSQ